MLLRKLNFWNFALKSMSKEVLRGMLTNACSVEVCIHMRQPKKKEGFRELPAIEPES